MRPTILTLLFFSVTFVVKAQSSNCNMSVTYSEMAFETYKKAYKTSDQDEMTVLLKKAVEESEQASAYALICNCQIAKNYALNAVTFGKKATKESDISEAKKLSKQAMNMSLDVMTATPNCKQ
ncbi:hypothetical protein ACM39_05870 [Chryseobacterium sp. FH2]|uniref:hypothetical protein n=1 Tax=Chryseobacterium sp. FH2 TaxID=1674291 RepID=UPI00065ACF32|nr:hypothetical protein [Chryseobacterium sp. FH2]KMQ68813.1 hypothetical protein ACM39_05870 [Chryseobacterium sp. FH2]